MKSPTESRVAKMERKNVWSRVAKMERKNVWSRVAKMERKNVCSAQKRADFILVHKKKEF